MARQPCSRSFVIISTPSILGIFTSVTIISGDRRTASSAPSSPFAASPAITQSRAAQSMVRIIPRLTIVSSSTTMTLYIRYLLLNRQPEGDGSPILRDSCLHTILLSVIYFQYVDNIV